MRAVITSLFRDKNLKTQIYLYIQYGLNIFFPILLFLYVLPIIGETNYGEIIYYQSIAAILSLFLDFGFEVLGIRLISKFNTDRLSGKIIVNVTIIKVTGLLIGVTILFLIYGFNELLIYSFWLPLYSILIPQWYYIGREKYKSLTLINFFHKLIIIVLILIFLDSETNYKIVPLISLISTLLLSSVSLINIRIFSYIETISLRNITYLSKYSFKVYSASLFIQIIKGSPKIILGNYGLYNAVTVYDIAEKFINLLKIPNIITTKILIQKLSNQFNKELLFSSLRKSIFFNVSVIILFNLLFSFIIDFLSIESSYELLIVTHLLSINVLIILLNNVCGQQVLVSLNELNKFYRAIISGGSFFIICLLLFISLELINVINLTILLLCTEILILIFLIYYIYKDENIKNRLLSRSTV